MAILMTLAIPGTTVEQYELVNELMGIRGDADAPDGLVLHICAVQPDGSVTIQDVWESEEKLNAFFESKAGPAFLEAGVPEAAPVIERVHNMIPRGSGSSPNVVVNIRVDAGTDVYDQLVAAMPTHVGDGSGHPVVAHVCAETAGGSVHVVDLWDSPEAFAAFAQTELGPAAGDRLGEVVPEFLPVHNVIRGRAPAVAA